MEVGVKNLKKNPDSATPQGVKKFRVVFVRRIPIIIVNA